MKSSSVARTQHGLRLLAAIASVPLAATLAGCGMGGSLASSAPPITGAALPVMHGSVHGGNQPIVGAKIQLYYAGVPATGSGYGVGGTPLLATPATTDASGSYSITGQYTCPGNPQTGVGAVPVYLVATAGNPGLSGPVNNTAIAEMVAIGVCPAGGNLLSSFPVINVSEVTTVAGVWALQQFMAAPSAANFGKPNIGAPTISYATGTTAGSIQSAVVGMTSAFTTARVLADPATGNSPNANFPYATPETAKINTLADILAFCVNSDPSTSTNCSSLFAAATPTGSAVATDTIQAAYYMAQNPINNVVTLYNFVAGAGAPFQPTYLAPYTQNGTSSGIAGNAFNDTTIAINYAPTYTAPSVGAATVPGVSAAFAVAIDAYGNAWVTNNGGVGTGGVASVAALGVDGSVIVPPTTTFTTSPTSGSTPQFTTAPTPGTRNVSTPRGVAVDLNNRAWIANFGDSASGTTTTGATTTGTVAVFTGNSYAGSNGLGGNPNTALGYFGGAGPYGVSIDGNNNVFVDNTSTNSTSVLDGRSLGKFLAADGTYTFSTSAAVTPPNQLTGGATLLAVDNNANQNVIAIDSQGCKVTGQYFSSNSGGNSTYYGVIGLYSPSTVQAQPGSEVATAVSNATVGVGVSGGNCGSTSDFIGQVVNAPFANPFGVAVDRNNGIWLTDLFTSGAGFDGVTYLAAPGGGGLIPSSTFLVNGVLPTASATAIAGSTINKAGAAIVDGNNNLWVANQSKASVAEAAINNSTITLLTPGQGSNLGTGATYGVGFQHNLSNSTGIAIDASGNVWLTNQGTSSTYTNQAGTTTLVGNSVTVVVGAAGPVVTPLALAVKVNKLGTKP